MFLSPTQSSVISPWLQEVSICWAPLSALLSIVKPPSRRGSTRYKRYSERSAGLTNGSYILFCILALPSPRLCTSSIHVLQVLSGFGGFDDLVREALSDLVGSPLPDWAWLKASLPSSLGGLNIRKASLHAPAAC